MPRPFLLDTSVLLHWVRNDLTAQLLEQKYQLERAPFRPLICEVSIGEMLAFSRKLGWGSNKQERLLQLEDWLVIVDLSDRRVHEAYADLSTLALKSGWSLFNAKNDLWVAAAAKVAHCRLLTFDKDFLPLCAQPDWRVDVLDLRTCERLG
ncbi:MAG TPA: PIN domain-containing protein [Terriglobales bacterium]|nr:PIN domain-containing protein [Terriglobales bacterium]